MYLKDMLRIGLNRNGRKLSNQKQFNVPFVRNTENSNNKQRYYIWELNKTLGDAR